MKNAIVMLDGVYVKDWIIANEEHGYVVTNNPEVHRQRTGKVEIIPPQGLERIYVGH
jgi:hypothetical protein